MAIHGFLGLRCEGNQDEDRAYGGDGIAIAKWAEEYDDDRTRAKRTFLNNLILYGAFFFGTIFVLISLFNSGLIPLVNNGQQQPRDYYYESVQSPLDLNDRAHVAVDLHGEIMGAQSPIRADITLYIDAADYIRYHPNDTLYHIDTRQPLAPYAQILFNGTSCQQPSHIFPQTIECWINLKLNDNYPTALTYNGTLFLYYSHGGNFPISLAAPTVNGTTVVLPPKKFIVIEPVQATAELRASQTAHDQWKATVVIAAIAAVFGGIIVYVKFYWYMDQHFRYK